MNKVIGFFFAIGTIFAAIIFSYGDKLSPGFGIFCFLAMAGFWFAGGLILVFSPWAEYLDNLEKRNRKP